MKKTLLLISSLVIGSLALVSCSKDDVAAVKTATDFTMKGTVDGGQYSLSLKKTTTFQGVNVPEAAGGIQKFTASDPDTLVLTGYFGNKQIGWYAVLPNATDKTGDFTFKDFSVINQKQFAVVAISKTLNDTVYLATGGTFNLSSYNTTLSTIKATATINMTKAPASNLLDIKTFTGTVTIEGVIAPLTR